MCRACASCIGSTSSASRSRWSREDLQVLDLCRPTRSLFACPVGECACLIVDGLHKAYAYPNSGDERKLAQATGKLGVGHLFPSAEQQEGLLQQLKSAHSTGTSACGGKACAEVRAMCGGSELKAASGDGKKSGATRNIDAIFAL